MKGMRVVTTGGLYIDFEETKRLLREVGSGILVTTCLGEGDSSWGLGDLADYTKSLPLVIIGRLRSLEDKLMERFYVTGDGKTDLYNVPGGVDVTIDVPQGGRTVALLRDYFPLRQIPKLWPADLLVLDTGLETLNTTELAGVRNFYSKWLKEDTLIVEPGLHKHRGRIVDFWLNNVGKEHEEYVVYDG